MDAHNHKVTSAIFITFSGNCIKALKFYQSCFGGTLQFQTFGKELLQDYTETPVVSGSLVSDRIIIHGSDLVHEEGRKIGNYMSIFLHCKTSNDRKVLIEKLEANQKFLFNKHDDDDDDQKLIEITDAFDVRWLLGV